MPIADLSALMLVCLQLFHTSSGKHQLDKQIEIMLLSGYALQAGNTAAVSTCTVARARSIRMVQLPYQLHERVKKGNGSHGNI